MANALEYSAQYRNLPGTALSQPTAPAIGLGRQATLLQKMFDSIDFCVLLIEPTGELLFSNAAARETIGDDLNSNYVRELLSHCSVEDLRAWHRAVADCLHGQRPMLRITSCPGRTLALAPVGDEGNGRAAMIMLTISRTRICSLDALNAFAAMHLLTRSERAILVALAEGASADQIAESRGVTEATIRTHIKNTLHKTGQANLRRLQAQLAQLPPVRTPLA
jgi:DNA-binding CsgD family transcriptional regulator